MILSQFINKFVAKDSETTLSLTNRCMQSITVPVVSTRDHCEKRLYQFPAAGVSSLNEHMKTTYKRLIALSCLVNVSHATSCTLSIIINFKHKREIKLIESNKNTKKIVIMLLYVQSTNDLRFLSYNNNNNTQNKEFQKRR